MCSVAQPLAARILPVPIVVICAMRSPASHPQWWDLSFSCSFTKRMRLFRVAVAIMPTRTDFVLVICVHILAYRQVRHAGNRLFWVPLSQ